MQKCRDNGLNGERRTENDYDYGNDRKPQRRKGRKDGKRHTAKTKNRVTDNGNDY